MSDSAGGFNAESRARLKAWLGQLDEDMLSGWANRGLLRRARIVLQPTASVEWTDAGPQAAIEGHRQSLHGPGFQHLRCSCPAAGPCHHLLAALLLWSAEATAAAEPQAPARSVPDLACWNQPDWAPLQRALGVQALRRASLWLEDGLKISFEEAATGLQASLSGAQEARLRFDAALGPEAALCSCGLPRCAHRAAALLVWRRARGLDVGALIESPRPRAEQQALDAARDSLLALAGEGLMQLSPQRLDQLEALAQRCRQAELPALARDLGALRTRLAEEAQRRARARPAQTARSLAQAWARTRALLARPAPRSRALLRGQHRREYSVHPTLDLQLLGLERWDREARTAGFSLHAMCLQSQRWWRLPIMAQFADRFEMEWRGLRWAGRSLPELLGRRLRLQGAWASADGSLSAREGTRWEDLAPPAAPANADSEEITLLTLAPEPRQCHGIAAALRAHCAARPDSRLDAQPGMALIGPLAFAEPTEVRGLDFIQIGRDVHGHALTLHLPASSDSRQRAIGRLRRAQARGFRASHVLGWLDLEDGRALLEPISLWSDSQGRWLHPHADDLLEKRYDSGDSTSAHFASVVTSPAEDALLQQLIGTRALLLQKLGNGCLHAQPGFVLSAQRWRSSALGQAWPELLGDLDRADPAATEASTSLLDALCRIELAIDARSAERWCADVRG
mgnify:CR=1 FL=1